MVISGVPVLSLARFAYLSLIRRRATYAKEYLAALTIVFVVLLPICASRAIGLLENHEFHSLFSAATLGLKILLPIPLMVEWCRHTLGNHTAQGLTFGRTEWRVLSLFFGLSVILAFLVVLILPVLNELGLTQTATLPATPPASAEDLAFMVEIVMSSIARAMLLAVVLASPLLARFLMAIPAITLNETNALATASSLCRKRLPAVITALAVFWLVPALVIGEVLYFLLIASRDLFDQPASWHLLSGTVDLCWNLLREGTLVVLVTVIYRYLHDETRP